MTKGADVASIDEAALENYLASHMPGFKGPLVAKKYNTGQSNPTYSIISPSGHCVLRRKPPGLLLKSAHAVDREYRVMNALASQGVPVPKMRVLCEDDFVLGTSFFVMDHVDGNIYWDPALPELDNAARVKIYDEMNRVLVALHSVDPNACGLGDYGKPGSYFQRQLTRWSQQYRASETGTIEAMDLLILWLEKNLPADDGRVSVVHGDYRIDNMIFDRTSHEVLAVLDWELSTLGHPFADLAYQCMQWRLPNAGTFRGLEGIDRKAKGIPTEADYVALYCQRMGFPKISNWAFYLAFSFFRLAAILQGVKKRALDGNASNPERARVMGENVSALAAMALTTIEKEGA